MAIELVGKRLGEFEVVRELGRGGMGVVYEAVQTSLNRRVALKVLGLGLGLTPKAVDRFRREAAAAAKLHHTNIVPVYATGEQHGVHFYAMELIDGPALDTVIRQLREHTTGTSVPALSPDLVVTAAHTPEDPLTSSSSVGSTTGSSVDRFDRIAAMIADVADALHHAHQNGVTHRDIKPSNLMLSSEGRLSVTDFGLARILEEPGMTVTGEFVGTPAYMSPEQITAGRIPLDHRTDIYSLGATLYELLTLRPPFTADGRDRLLALVIQKDPTAPRSLNPKISRDLETICLKCLEKDPDRRYQTAKDLADDLRRFVNRFAILARRTGPFGRMKKWAKRNPALAAALAGAFACAAVAGGLAYRAHRTELERREDAARRDAELLQEKQRAALEKAVLASRLENFAEARQAILEAEKLGCSAGQIRMLQGQLDFYQGHLKEAIDNLKAATKLLPESVAAWSMLSVACAYASRNTEAYVAIKEATRRSPVTAEDYLFLGHFESMDDPERGMATLEKALQMRRSPLAQLVYLDALRMYLLDFPDLEKAKLGMESIRAIKRQFDESPMILNLSVLLHLACHNVFDEYQQLALRDEALAEGLKDAIALERYADSSRAVAARWLFFKEIGRPEQGVANLRRYVEKHGDVYACICYGQYLYKSGDFRSSLAVLDKKKGEMSIDLSRVFVLAETEGVTAASRLIDEMTNRGLTDWDVLNSQLMLRFLGRKEEAVALSLQALNRPADFPAIGTEQYRLALAYCAGKLPANELIAKTRGRGNLSNAYLCIGLTALADGDRDAARRNFQRGMETREYERLPYEFCQMLLARMDMDKDKTWPPWK